MGKYHELREKLAVYSRVFYVTVTKFIILSCLNCLYIVTLYIFQNDFGSTNMLKYVFFLFRKVWSLLLGNKLGITRELFNTCLSQSKHHIKTNIIEHSGIIQYETTNSNHNEHYSLFNLDNTENSTFNCSMCNFIFSKLNTIPIKREFTHVPCVTSNLTNLHQHYMKNSSEGEEVIEAFVSTNSFKIDPSDFEQSNRTGSLVVLFF